MKFYMKQLLFAACAVIGMNVGAVGPVHPIKQSDFFDGNNQPTKTLEIIEPGLYEFVEDISFAPIDEVTSAIRILSDDVTIDLKKFALRQTNDTLQVVGIRIGDELDFNNPSTRLVNNVTIQNGSILTFTDSGISAINSAPTILPAGGVFSSLQFLDLDILRCGVDGTFANGSGIDLTSFVATEPNVDWSDSRNIAFRDITIRNVHADSGKGNAGIFIITGDSVVITNTTVNDFRADIVGSSLSTFAYWIVCRNLQMFDCQGNRTVQTDRNVLVEQVGGAVIADSVGVHLKNVQFNDAEGVAADLVNGANFSNTRDALFEDVQFNNPTGTTELAGDINGIHMSDTPGQTTDANSMKFVRCQFNGAKRLVGRPVPGASCGTIIITVKNLTFESCESQRINTSFDFEDEVYGFLIGAGYSDPAAPEFANVQNIVFKDCIVSDLSANGEVVGYAFAGFKDSRDGRQAIQTNFVIENSIAQHIRSVNAARNVAGIAEYNYPILEVDTFELYPTMKNLFVRNCRVSDVYNTGTVGVSAQSSEKPFSAGIVVESVTNPVIIGNSISDCERGILFTGSNRIDPNGFQLALTQEGALATPPQFIEIGESPLVIRNSVNDQAFPCRLAGYSPSFEVTEGRGAIADPVNACASLNPNVDYQGTVTVCRRGTCFFVQKTTNVEAAGAVGTVIVNTVDAPFGITGVPTGTGPTVTLPLSTGNELIALIQANPDIVLTIDTEPSSAVPQQFINLTKGNQVDVTPLARNRANIIEAAPADLTALGWESGDAIQYVAEAGNMPGLESGTTYYAIVYKPGFTESGLVKDNDITSCTISGFQDDRCPTTSAFVSNTAFKNGEDHCSNYAINWSGKAPVCKGDLAQYPCCDTPYNVSLIAAQKHDKKENKKKHSRKR